MRCKRNWVDVRAWTRAKAKGPKAFKGRAGVVPCPRHWSIRHKMLSGTGKVSFGWQAGKQEAEEMIVLVQSLTALSS